MNRRRPPTLEPISAAMFVIVSLHLAAAFGVWWWWQETGAGRIRSAEARLQWMTPGDFKSQLSQPPPPTNPTIATSAKKAPTASAPSVKKTDDPPVQKATLVAGPAPQHQMEPVPNTAGSPLFAQTTSTAKLSANRSITLRRAQERRTVPPAVGAPAPPMASPTLLDIARLNTLRPASPVPVPEKENLQMEEVSLDGVDEAVNAAFLAAWTAPPLDSVPDGQREGRLSISIGKDGTLLKSQMSKFSGSHVLDQSILEASAHVKKISTTLPSKYSKDSYDLELSFLLLP
ncbi:TonB C-terminal domain-containing protein [Prosthecobacter sp.]|uniref:TonB C-terminal domain-containing protein n=1 Tax=Prosthecobacter sp. TaxID=1965333 RepID=UPI001D2BC7EA|nr:TonB C-terminal domain-containing protein [Prosthecobacter sp.]MCB1275627.1 hypothetical protein [Prosthecobacter sp.]